MVITSRFRLSSLLAFRSGLLAPLAPITEVDEVHRAPTGHSPGCTRLSEVANTDRQLSAVQPKWRRRNGLLADSLRYQEITVVKANVHQRLSRELGTSA